MYRYRLVGLVLIAIAASCSYQDWFDRLVPDRESEFAEEYLAKLRERDFAFVEAHLHESLEAEVTQDKLAEIVSYFPDGKPLSTELIGSQVHIWSGHWQGNFTFEYEFADGWAVAHALVYKDGDELSVAGFSVTRTLASQREINRFTLSDKSPLQYAVLTMAVVFPIFILGTVYVCARTPMRRRKWLWILFILFGFGSIVVNWTTGQFGILPLSFRLLGASASAAKPHAPWVIGVSLPIGAILFWIKRRRLTEQRPGEESLDTTSMAESAAE